MAKSERKVEEEPPERKPFLLRLSPDLMAELKGWAAQDLRSLNSHIEFLLREAVKRRKGTK
ncbi:MAG: Arc family DNA-binding protein [Planctomycetota bacterium]|nr:Arc family DNA-binding protein [Planctomycetota bacterium]